VGRSAQGTERQHVSNEGTMGGARLSDDKRISLKFNILTFHGAKGDCVWFVTSHKLYRFYRIGSSYDVWHN
jgi:hypothetical protein